MLQITMTVMITLTLTRITMVRIIIAILIMRLVAGCTKRFVGCDNVALESV